MRSRIHILTMVTALLVTMVVPFVPHHHHNGVACFVMEHCEHSSSDHENCGEPHSDGSSCIEDAKYLSSSSYEEVDVSMLLFSFISPFILNLLELNIPAQIPEYQYFSTGPLPPGLSTLFALRAPPFIG